MSKPRARAFREEERVLVFVEWTDAASSTDMRWRALPDLEETKPFLSYSVGWLMVEHPDHITVAPHFGNVGENNLDEQAMGEVNIPRAMIRRIVRLEDPGGWGRQEPATVRRLLERHKTQPPEEEPHGGG